MCLGGSGSATVMPPPPAPVLNPALDATVARAGVNARLMAQTAAGYNATVLSGGQGPAVPAGQVAKPLTGG